MHRYNFPCPARATGLPSAASENHAVPCAVRQPIVVMPIPSAEYGNVGCGNLWEMPVPPPQGTSDLSATMQYGPWPRQPVGFHAHLPLRLPFVFVQYSRPTHKVPALPRRPGRHSLIRKKLWDTILVQIGPPFPIHLFRFRIHADRPNGSVTFSGVTSPRRKDFLPVGIGSDLARFGSPHGRPVGLPRAPVVIVIYWFPSARACRLFLRAGNWRPTPGRLAASCFRRQSESSWLPSK